MRGLNQSMVIGNLGAEPEMRYTGDGKAVTTFSVASNRSWKNDKGNIEEETTWFRITTWENLAETCNKFLKKGSAVFCQGRMHNNSWQGKDKTFHDGMELIANTVLFLGGNAKVSDAASSKDPSDAVDAMVDSLRDTGVQVELS